MSDHSCYVPDLRGGRTPRELSARLERFDGGEIDLDAWDEFLSASLPDADQDSADAARGAWGAYLRRRLPDTHHSRPPVPAHDSLLREERVELYALRAALGLDLFHPADARPVELIDDEYTEAGGVSAWEGRR